VLTDVGAIDDFEEGRVRMVRIQGREIGLFRWSNAFFAVRNICPHESGPLCNGPLEHQIISSEVGTLSVDPEVPVLTCPWHGWEFNLLSGQSLTDPAYRVAVYPVRIDAGRVLVELGRSREGETPGAKLAPAGNA
jgi:nitrite reductase/ring-hydroxylating ferredoxin subunit